MSASSHTHTFKRESRASGCLNEGGRKRGAKTRDGESEVGESHREKIAFFRPEHPVRAADDAVKSLLDGPSEMRSDPFDVFRLRRSHSFV